MLAESYVRTSFELLVFAVRTCCEREEAPKSIVTDSRLGNIYLILCYLDLIMVNYHHVKARVLSVSQLNRVLNLTLQSKLIMKIASTSPIQRFYAHHNVRATNHTRLRRVR